MNRYLAEKWMFVEACTTLRTELLDAITDTDLAFSPGGSNPTLGELLVQMAEIEHSYLQGVTTLTQGWGFRADAGMARSVGRLRAWFDELDTELTAAVGGFDDDDLSRGVTRESGYVMPIEISLDAYVQATLINVGKSSVYLRAMNRQLPESMQDWIW